jgi:hypothetical protein
MCDFILDSFAAAWQTYRNAAPYLILFFFAFGIFEEYERRKSREAIDIGKLCDTERGDNGEHSS